MGKKIIPVSALTNTERVFGSADEAARSALRDIKDRRSEWGGGVVYNPHTNQYAYTDAVGQDDGAHFAARLHIPSPWVLHSLYHTHPEGADSTKFSADDIAAAKALGVHSYVLSLEDNHIHVFDPTRDKIFHDPQGIGDYAPGNVIQEQ